MQCDRRGADHRQLGEAGVRARELVIGVGWRTGTMGSKMRERLLRSQRLSCSEAVMLDEPAGRPGRDSPEEQGRCDGERGMLRYCNHPPIRERGPYQRSRYPSEPANPSTPFKAELLAETARAACSKGARDGLYRLSVPIPPKDFPLVPNELVEHCHCWFLARRRMAIPTTENLDSLLVGVE